MKRPIVSVLIPVYNVEKYLEKCLDSIIQQTLLDIEIICVNDGSTDHSEEILKKYEKKDNRIIVINKANGGLPSARNAGLDRATGKYVGFVDSDDFIQPDMYEKLVYEAEKNSSDIVICGANIFPETPRANQWLYDTLSPTYKHYDEYTSEILFNRVDTTPFLWRTLVRKKLIDEGQFRLDEDIVIGEDKAFQCKIYPCAKAITVIPDKLYNYYWCRPESLMGKQVYGKYEKRVKEHTKLVGRICDDLFSKTLDYKKRDETLRDFLEWSIPFIYDDFMYLPEKQKCELAKLLISSWVKADFYHYKYSLPEWKREAFEYIKTFAFVKKTCAPLLSIIVPVEYTTEYIDEWIKHMKGISDNKIEIIVINNGTSNENYLKIQTFLYNNTYVRLYNTPAHMNYADSLNMGFNLAYGEYVAFLEVQDWYKSKESLLKWLAYAQELETDICVSTYCMKKNLSDCTAKTISESKSEIGDFEVDYHNVLYKKNFLLQNKIVFTNASVMTGYLFMCQAILKAVKKEYFAENVYIIREMFHADWISTEKCELVLDALNELLELSLESRNAYLHGKVFSILNSNMLKRIIVNNTKPYCMPTWQCPNGENSQIKSVSSIFEIISKADPDLLYESGFSDDDNLVDILYEVIKERQKFLAEF